MSRSVQDYPEHLNPFDDNYGRPATPVPPARHKYNTWSGKRALHVSDKKKEEKPSFLEKPWNVLGGGGKGKLVRRLSFLKTAVERVSFRRRGRPQEQPRSNSLHEDLTYRITSPKVKERLRLQALPALARLDNKEVSASSTDVAEPPQENGRVSSPLALTEGEGGAPGETDIPPVGTPVTSQLDLGAGGVRLTRRSTRKKRPPPPPPPARTTSLTNGSSRPEDSISASSSITQELEKALESVETDSLAEFEFDREKLLELDSTFV